MDGGSKLLCAARAFLLLLNYANRERTRKEDDKVGEVLFKKK